LKSVKTTFLGYFCYLYEVKKENPKPLNIYEERFYKLLRLIRIAKMMRSAKIKITPQTRS
jgi:hypothetical protein